VRSLVAATAILCAALAAAPGCRDEPAPQPSARSAAADPEPDPVAPTAGELDDPPDHGDDIPALTPRPSDPELGGYHLDPDPVNEPAATDVSGRRPTRAVELLLRSTPPGAIASIDGQPLGKTPILWAGKTDGQPREFTFALPGYAVARYRFIPTRSGVVHGSLRRLVTGPDAGPR
jgi:hypothetical protein